MRIDMLGDVTLSAGVVERTANIRQTTGGDGAGVIGERERPATDTVTRNATDDPRQIKKGLSDFEQTLKESNISLKFSRDQETGKTVIQLVDATSGETLNQIPSAALLHLSAVLGKLQGLVFSHQA